VKEKEKEKEKRKGKKWRGDWRNKYFITFQRVHWCTSVRFLQFSPVQFL
jgi:hypothetical protein